MYRSFLLGLKCSSLLFGSVLSYFRFLDSFIYVISILLCVDNNLMTVSPDLLIHKCCAILYIA